MAFGKLFRQSMIFLQCLGRGILEIYHIRTPLGKAILNRQYIEKNIVEGPSASKIRACVLLQRVKLSDKPRHDSIVPVSIESGCRRDE